MSLLDVEIPSLDKGPDGSSKSAVRQQLTFSARRRTVLRMAVGAGMALGLTALELLPGKKAHAGWWSTYPTWPDCAGYYNSTTTCTPPSWDISSFNCNGAGYHRDDGASGTCYSQRWYVKPTTCGGRNAWTWTSNRTRCSDGYYVYSTCGGSGTTDSICKYNY